MNEKDIEKVLKTFYIFDLKVKWRDFRVYDINFSLKLGNDLVVESVAVIYDMRATKEQNISNFCDKIDSEIIKIFRKDR